MSEDDLPRSAIDKGSLEEGSRALEGFFGKRT